MLGTVRANAVASGTWSMTAVKRPLATVARTGKVTGESCGSRQPGRPPSPRGNTSRRSHVGPTTFVTHACPPGSIAASRQPRSPHGPATASRSCFASTRSASKVKTTLPSAGSLRLSLPGTRQVARGHQSQHSSTSFNVSSSIMLSQRDRLAALPGVPPACSGSRICDPLPPNLSRAARAGYRTLKLRHVFGTAGRCQPSIAGDSRTLEK
jgi:hypothetical protein